MGNSFLKIICLSVVVHIIAVPSGRANDFGKSDTLHSTSANQMISEIIALEKDDVINKANGLLKKEPVTVTASSCPRSAGGKHDYYSEGPYWWPDPKNPDGPYIRKDGLKNPQLFSSHESALQKMATTVSTLTSAYLLTGEEKYARAVLPHLMAWFVDTTTMMNPNLLYAQALLGINNGRGAGVLDGATLIDVARCVQILERSKFVNPEDISKFKHWFRKLMDWITTHPNGIHEMNAKNNHGSWWNAQVAAYASLVGDNKMLQLCREHYKNILIPNQMASNGSFPLELARTRPFSYSLFNLDALSTLAIIASDKDNDLWNFELADGRGLKKALKFILPFVKNPQEWPYGKDVSLWENQPGPRPFMFYAALAFGDKAWLEIWKAQSAKQSSKSKSAQNRILWLGLGYPLSAKSAGINSGKDSPEITAIRCKINPIIRPEMLKSTDGEDINGPSMIKVPEWIISPLGKYYLYFAHHQGKYIRLAYADQPEGPWKIYEKGTLKREDCIFYDGTNKLAVKHIASPDILIDPIKKELVMYFHISAGKTTDGMDTPQVTLRATSKDGINFVPEHKILGESYFRVFKWDNRFYALAKGGLYRSDDGFSGFDKGPNPFLNINDADSTIHLRHLALLQKGNTLYLFYSWIGDAPERILYSKMLLKGDWGQWQASAPVTLLLPAEKYEGVDQPIIKSVSGASKTPVRQLRDPAIYQEGDQTYLLYSVAGELGIAIAKLNLNLSYY